MTSIVYHRFRNGCGHPYVDLKPGMWVCAACWTFDCPTCGHPWGEHALTPYKGKVYDCTWCEGVCRHGR